MKIHSYSTVLKNNSEPIFLVPIGDTHLGVKSCDKTKLTELVNWIKETPNVYWLGMGDYGDYVAYSDKRFDASSSDSDVPLDDLFDSLTKKIAGVFEPIRNRCVGLLEGNHEDSVRLKYHYSPVRKLAELLGTKELTYTSMIRWDFKGQHRRSSNITIYASHGFGSGESAMSKLKKQSEGFDADIYLMGHVHRKKVEEEEKLYVPCKGEPKLLKKKQWFGITGTFSKCYEDGVRNYGEKPGYKPTPIGVIKIRIEPFKQQKGCTVPHIHISL